MESADYYLSEAQKLAAEQNLPFEIGRAYYLRAVLERKNLEAAKNYLNEAIKLFVEVGSNYELSLVNYELAGVLLDMEEWEQALQILKNNRKINREIWLHKTAGTEPHSKAKNFARICFANVRSQVLRKPAEPIL